MSEERTVRVVIRGRVQGVGFRWWTAGRARDLRLDGWVRNRSDGTVEAVFRGPAGRLAEMLEACRQGPPAGRVTTLEEFAAEPDEAGEGGFEQRSTL
jgi:acylphosphatase